MLIACPSRATSCFVEPANLQPNGRRVRLSSVWRNEPSRAAGLIAAAEALVADALVPDAPVAQWPPNSPGAATQSPEVRAEVAAAGEPINDAPDAPPVAQEAAEEAPEQLEPAEATAALAPDAPPILPDLDEGRPPIDADAQPIRLETVANDKAIETAAARHFGSGAEQRQHVGRPSRQQIPILALIVPDSIVVGWGKNIVRLLPRTAWFYAAIDPSVNLRRLACYGASTRAEQHEGAPSWSCRATSSTKRGGWSKCRD